MNSFLVFLMIDQSTKRRILNIGKQTVLTPYSCTVHLFLKSHSLLVTLNLPTCTLSTYLPTCPLTTYLPTSTLFTYLLICTLSTYFPNCTLSTYLYLIYLPVPYLLKCTLSTYLYPIYLNVPYLPLAYLYRIYLLT